MNTAGRKAKGRNLQKWLREQLLTLFPSLEPDDIQSTSMGAGGEDLKLSPAARKLIPYSFECKNSETINIWKAWEQSSTNANNYAPILIFKKNHKKPLVVLSAEEYFRLIK